MLVSWLFTKLKLYYVCILPIMLYGSECWALSKADVRKIDALDQWCLIRILDIRWYHRVSNWEVRRLTEQPLRCGDYWQQALRTDGACRIMMMMMMAVYSLYVCSRVEKFAFG